MNITHRTWLLLFANDETINGNVYEINSYVNVCNLQDWCRWDEYMDSLFLPSIITVYYIVLINYSVLLFSFLFVNLWLNITLTDNDIINLMTGTWHLSINHIKEMIAPLFRQLVHYIYKHILAQTCHLVLKNHPAKIWS